MNARALLLTAGLLLIACDEPPRAEKPAGGPPAAVRALDLAPGVLDEASLQGGEERAYLFDLAAGHYAEVVVDQQGIDVEVRLRAADGRTVAVIDSSNGILGPEPLPFVAVTGGRFRLEVRSLAHSAPAGRYTLRLDALRPAAEHDRARVAAETLLAECLAQEDTPASLRGALARGEEALARFQTLGLPEREVEALFCLGSSQARLGDRKAAAGFFRQALERVGSLEDEARTGVILSNLGMLALADGRPRQALALYRQALPLLRQSRNAPEEARTLNNIAHAAMSIGEIGEAVAATEEAVSLARTLRDRLSEGMMLSNLGQLEMDLGRPQLALEHIDGAVDLLEEAGDRRGLGVALSRRGVALALGHRPREEVVESFQRALRLQRATGDRRREAVTLHDLGWYHRRAGELREAERLFRQALAVFQAQGLRANEAGALVNLGDVDLALGRLARAGESFLRARALFSAIGDPAEETNALFGLARVRRAAGRPEEALTAIEDACSRIEALRRKSADLQIRLTFFASRQDIYGLRVDLLSELHRRNPRAGYDGRALLAGDEARARTLLDLLDEAHVEGGARAARLARSQAMSLRDIQSQIVEPGDLLLEYFLGEERSFLWAVTSGTIESFELPPRQELEAGAREGARLLAASNRAMARQPAEIALDGLSRLLLDPVAHRLRAAERLVIIPDGALWFVSFAALPDPGAGDPPEDRPPLVIGHEIVILPSLSVLPRLRRAAAGRCPAPGTIAVLADPVFDAADPRVTPRSAPRSEVFREAPGRFKRLPFSRAEAQAILSVAPPRGTFVALDFAASREAVLTGRLASSRIVHFATHAALDTEHPERSGVALSMVDPHGRPRDGFLRLAEIYRLDLPADLVVLSACRTALGQEIRGEGLVGLTRGFFSAGARQVLVSLWPVEDRATAELMRRFYSEMLGRGHPPAAALRAAQTAMWRDKARRSPYYWAGFILQGDWRAAADKPVAHEADLSTCGTANQISGG